MLTACNFEEVILRRKQIEAIGIVFDVLKFATQQQDFQCSVLEMLSTAMQYYCPAGPQSAYAKAPKSGMPYYLGDPIPSPTYLSGAIHSPLSLYTRPQFPFPTHTSVTQGLLATPTAKVTQSSETAAAALIALQEQPVVHTGEVGSPSAGDCKVLSPIKLEQLSPGSVTTPPSISITKEADSSTNTTSTDQGYTSSVQDSGAITIQVSEQHETGITGFPTITNMYTEAARMSCPQFETTYTQPPGLPVPFSHASSYSQPAQNAYTTIRYPPTAAAMPHISPLSGYFPQLPPRRDEIFPRNNSCHMCGKTYARQSTLKTHLRSHSGEKPYQCSICQKSFTQAANLTAHLRTHSGEKPFKCPVCNRGFSQSSSVTTHMRTHSGDRPYKCNVCNKGFADSSTLTKHFRTHTGEKPYQCKICDARFSQSGNLNRHMRTHRNHFQGAAVLGHVQ